MPGRRSARGSRYLPRTHLARQSPQGTSPSFSRLLGLACFLPPPLWLCEWDANRRCGALCLPAVPRFVPRGRTTNTRCVPRCPVFVRKVRVEMGCAPQDASCRPVREAPPSRACGFPHLQRCGNSCRSVTNPGARLPLSARTSSSKTQVVEDARRKPAAKAKGRLAGTSQVTPP